jgi:hypothetical protein
MSTKTSYPIRLEAKLLNAVRPIAKREGRTLKAQLERIIGAAVASEADHAKHVKAHLAEAKP